MNSNKQNLINKVIYRSQYRGTKEMDILMTAFVRSIINNIDENYLETLNDFVNMDDETLKSIRKKYIKLTKEHHPDLLISKGVPIEVINESKNKMRAINAAWDQIQKLKSN